MTVADLAMINDIDATIDSQDYLHLDVSGEGMSRRFAIEPRKLRERAIRSNAVGDELAFSLRQLVTDIDEGWHRAGEHEGVLVCAAAAKLLPEAGVIQLVDLRVDSDRRREGLATALLYDLQSYAREHELRAILAETLSDNGPANALLARLGFELSGLDTLRRSNHDLVKEQATIAWYLTFN
jgi:ribosomal protein S18 acetylase RimI-like enzyme